MMMPARHGGFMARILPSPRLRGKSCKGTACLADNPQDRPGIGAARAARLKPPDGGARRLREHDKPIRPAY
jgi:hypothetical protein